ncbi:hypothetical protein KKD40_05780 [Candidatus Micrarchaeota archaeon]|nr:hypothetical protein [Candidatus Micrarchaeota archaeon]
MSDDLSTSVASLTNQLGDSGSQLDKLNFLKRIGGISETESTAFFVRDTHTYFLYKLACGELDVSGLNTPVLRKAAITEFFNYRPMEALEFMSILLKSTPLPTQVRDHALTAIMGVALERASRSDTNPRVVLGKIRELPLEQCGVPKDLFSDLIYAMDNGRVSGGNSLIDQYTRWKIQLDFQSKLDRLKEHESQLKSGGLGALISSFDHESSPEKRVGLLQQITASEDKGQVFVFLRRVAVRITHHPDDRIFALDMIAKTKRSPITLRVLVEILSSGDRNDVFDRAKDLFVELALAVETQSDAKSFYGAYNSLINPTNIGLNADMFSGVADHLTKVLSETSSDDTHIQSVVEPPRRSSGSSEELVSASQPKKRTIEALVACCTNLETPVSERVGALRELETNYNFSRLRQDRVTEARESLLSTIRSSVDDPLRVRDEGEFIVEFNLLSSDDQTMVMRNSAWLAESKNTPVRMAILRQALLCSNSHTIVFAAERLANFNDADSVALLEAAVHASFKKDTALEKKSSEVHEQILDQLAKCDQELALPALIRIRDANYSLISDFAKYHISKIEQSASVQKSKTKTSDESVANPDAAKLMALDEMLKSRKFDQIKLIHFLIHGTEAVQARAIEVSAKCHSDGFMGPLQDGILNAGLPEAARLRFVQAYYLNCADHTQQYGMAYFAIVVRNTELPTSIRLAAIEVVGRAYTSDVYSEALLHVYHSPSESNEIKEAARQVLISAYKVDPSESSNPEFLTPDNIEKTFAAASVAIGSGGFPEQDTLHKLEQIMIHADKNTDRLTAAELIGSAYKKRTGCFIEKPEKRDPAELLAHAESEDPAASLAALCGFALCSRNMADRAQTLLARKSFSKDVNTALMLLDFAKCRNADLRDTLFWHIQSIFRNLDLTDQDRILSALPTTVSNDGIPVLLNKLMENKNEPDIQKSIVGLLGTTDNERSPLILNAIVLNPHLGQEVRVLAVDKLRENIILRRGSGAPVLVSLAERDHFDRDADVDGAIKAQILLALPTLLEPRYCLKEFFVEKINGILDAHKLEVQQASILDKMESGDVNLDANTLSEFIRCGSENVQDRAMRLLGICTDQEKVIVAAIAGINDPNLSIRCRIRFLQVLDSHCDSRSDPLVSRFADIIGFERLPSALRIVAINMIGKHFPDYDFSKCPIIERTLNNAINSLDANLSSAARRARGPNYASRARFVQAVQTSQFLVSQTARVSEPPSSSCPQQNSNERRLLSILENPRDSDAVVGAAKTIREKGIGNSSLLLPALHVALQTWHGAPSVQRAIVDTLAVVGNASSIQPIEKSSCAGKPKSKALAAVRKRNGGSKQSASKATPSDSISPNATCLGVDQFGLRDVVDDRTARLERELKELADAGKRHGPGRKRRTRR